MSPRNNPATSRSPHGTLSLDVPDGSLELLSVNQLAGLTEFPPAVRAVNTIFSDAIEAGASDIHVEPHEADLTVRFRIDGSLVDAITLPRDLESSIVSRLKTLGQLDVAERVTPQAGRGQLRIGSREIDLRISTLPGVFGEKVVVRLLSNGGGPLPLDQLWIRARSFETFQHLLRYPEGMVVVAGPTGSGTTTTLYSALKHLGADAKDIVTIESPIEFKMPLATQVEVSGTFAPALRSVLEQDPDVILVGEVRDSDTARLVAEAAQTGHLVLTALRTNDAATTIVRFLELGIEPLQLAASLSGVLAQRLVRRVCQTCAVYSEPPAQAVLDLRLDDGLYAGCTWLTGVGCPTCKGTGYTGRVAIHELLEITDEIRSLISARAPAHVIRDAAKRQGMVPLLDDGIAKAAEGLTTLMEILRVVPCFDAPKAGDPFAGQGLDRSTTASTTPRAADTNPGIRPGTAILVIEDESDTQALLKLILEESGYNVTTAGDGIEALLALGKSRFDLILSDINMPNMDGIALLDAKVQKGIDTPIVFLSADASDRREQQCLELGAVDYIRKPIKKDVLLLRLRRALG
jgi:type II secretory ATPase GspE/PulE/Tfp pilus assembly ATPase PilB-like protein/CheY-like chemotaxis protein